MDVLIAERRVIEGHLVPPGALSPSIRAAHEGDIPDSRYHFSLGEVLGEKYSDYILVFPVGTVPRLEYGDKIIGVHSSRGFTGYHAEERVGVTRGEERKTVWNVNIRCRDNETRMVLEVRCKIVNLNEKQQADLEARLKEAGSEISLTDYAI